MVFYSSWVSGAMLCLPCQRWTRLFWDLFNKQLMDVDTHLPLQLVTIWCLCWHCFENLIPGDLNRKSSNLLYFFFLPGTLFFLKYFYYFLSLLVLATQLLPFRSEWEQFGQHLDEFLSVLWLPLGSSFSLKVICILPNCIPYQCRSWFETEGWWAKINKIAKEELIRSNKLVDRSLKKSFWTSFLFAQEFRQTYSSCKSYFLIHHIYFCREAILKIEFKQSL